MQVKIEDQSTVKKIIHIEISGEDVTTELDKMYKDISKSASIKGFRKGKIPRKVLETRFGKDVKSDVVSKLIQNSYIEAIKENSISNILGQPVLPDKLPELEQGKPFNFSINIEVSPVLADIELEGIELKKNLYKPSEEEIDAQLQMIRKDMATKQTVTEVRPINESDFVLIDYQGFIDGVPFEHTPKIENYLMDIRTKNMPVEFSEKLIGSIPPQELEIEVDYPNDDNTNNIFAGKKVTYKIFAKEIQEKILPSLDDTFAQRLGTFDTLEDLKNKISFNLTESYKVRINQELSEQVFTQLLEKIDFELPEILVESELSAIIAEVEYLYLQQNVSFESVGVTKDMIRTQYRDLAEKQARRHILLEKIIEQEKLQLTDKDMESIYANMAKALNVTIEDAKALCRDDKNSFHFNHLKSIELEKKAMAHVINNATIIEVQPVAEEASDLKESESNSTPILESVDSEVTLS